MSHKHEWVQPVGATTIYACACGARSDETGARLSALLTVAEVALIDEPDTHDGLVAAIEGILTGRLEAVLRVTSEERLERIRRLVDHAERHQERLSPRLVRAALGDRDE